MIIIVILVIFYYTRRNDFIKMLALLLQIHKTACIDCELAKYY